MELILAAVVAVGVWMFCLHLVQVGVDKQKAADKAEYEAQLAARLEQWQRATVEHQEREKALQTQLNDTESKFLTIAANLPKHAVSHDTTSTDPCPPLRLDADWLRAFEAAGTAATVPYPGGSAGAVPEHVPASP